MNLGISFIIILELNLSLQLLHTSAVDIGTFPSAKPNHATENRANCRNNRAEFELTVGWGFNPPVPLFIPLWTPQPLSSSCVADPSSSFFTIQTQQWRRHASTDTPLEMLGMLPPPPNQPRFSLALLLIIECRLILHCTRAVARNLGLGCYKMCWGCLNNETLFLFGPRPMGVDPWITLRNLWAP